MGRVEVFFSNYTFRFFPSRGCKITFFSPVETYLARTQNIPPGQHRSVSQARQICAEECVSRKRYKGKKKREKREEITTCMLLFVLCFWLLKIKI